MSNSVFKELPSRHSDDPYGSGDSNNLVVFINKNGSVSSVDQSALHDLLVNDATETNTSVSVVQLGSPTPSVELELDEQEELEKEMSQHRLDDDEDDVEETEKSVKNRKIVSVTVENFFNPAEAKQLASDILSLTGMNPLAIQIDYDFQRFVIANDHCYTPLTSPSQRTSKPVSRVNSPVRTPAANESTTSTISTSADKQPTTDNIAAVPSAAAATKNNIAKKPTATNSELSDNDDFGSDEDDEDEDGSDLSDFSPSESENDRDSDLDFNVNERSSRMKKFNRSKNMRSKQLQQAKQNSVKLKQKRQSDINSTLDLTDEPVAVTPPNSKKRPLVKPQQKKLLTNNRSTTLVTSTPVAAAPSPKSKVIIATSASSRPPLVKTYSVKPKPENMENIKKEQFSMRSGEASKNISTISLPGPPVPALAPISSGGDSLSNKLSVVRKDKKPPVYTEALFSDMSSLFSTPDIIKKVGGAASVSTTSTTASTQPKTTTTPAKCYFMPLTPNNIKNRSQLPAHISLRTHQNPSSTNLGSEQDKQLDLIDSIVQQELKQTTTPTKATMSADIPNIVKMLENPVGIDVAMTNVMNLNQTNQQMSQTAATPPLPPQNIVPTTTTISNISFSANVPSSLLDDSDLLDGLTNPDDGLTEDLLQHVAKLVEDKNLQEVIDSQVLGGATPIVTTAAAVQIPKSLQIPSRIVAPVVTPTNVVTMTSIKPVVTQATPTRGKEPIKIIRSDGRVITLPPIEAPTTRSARKKAQNQPTVESPVVAATQKKEEQISAAVPQTTPKAIKPIKHDQIIKTTKDRRASTAQKKGTTVAVASDLSAKLKTPAKSLLNTSIDGVDPLDDEFDDEDSDGSYNSEDDPFRLWCICRQPHNNRFMICCDKCEDWFHGKCVNITKAMGVEMEERGVEWVCPNCIKKQPKKLNERKSSSTSNQSVQESANLLSTTMLSCIVCKKMARQSSIYCSDDCIRRHATQTTTSNNSLAAAEMDKSKAKASSTSTAKQGASAKYVINSNNRVVVFEQRTGRCLTGMTAPTPENLKEWLREHPTFEIVQPNSAQAIAISAKQQQLRQLGRTMEAERRNQAAAEANKPQKIQTTLKVGSSNKIVLVNPQKQPQQQQQQGKQAAPKVIMKVAKIPQNVSLKPGSPKKTSSAMPKQQQQTPNQQTKLAQQKINRSLNKSNESATSSKQSNQPEPIRVNVRRTLKEQLALRMAETVDEKLPKLSGEEIERYAEETENEIFELFSKDTGTRYRAKYRSLMFNIKDRKNQSLFRKICDKTIQPKQLVRMSAEELASQELALWRENENKHHLEMIKKSELDLLACAKNYVLKTHKGEEVIESKISDRVKLDPSVSVEDVVSVLNNSTVSSTSETHEPDATVPVKDTRIDSRFEKYLSVDSSSGLMNKSLNTSGGSSTTASAKKKDVQRSRSKSRDRQESKKSSSSSKHKRKRSRERRSKSRDRGTDRVKERKKDDVRSDKKDKPLSSSADRKKDEAPPKKVVESLKSEPPKPKLKEENFNLIDKILEAQSTIDRILRPDEPSTKKNTLDDNKIVKNQTATLEPVQKSVSNESDQEPTSTVTIPTPPESLYNKDSSSSNDASDDNQILLWSGSIIMIDVATFEISAHPFSGDCSAIKGELPEQLEVVGRISPDTVWDYIGKIKKSLNKEIIIMRFSGASEDQNDAYYTLYKYLFTRKRLGVVKTTSNSMKDFYIFPLAAHKSIPSVLTPIVGPGFESGRPDLLLGIIVKITTVSTKRSSATAISSIPSKVSRLSSTLSKSKHVKTVIGEEHFTPPSSPKGNQRTPKLPVTTALTIAAAVTDSKATELIEDGDEPYSPGGSDDDCIIEPSQVSNFSLINPPALLPPPPPPPEITSYTQLREQEEIQRKMEELNRQIEAQKMEIAGMLQPEQQQMNEETFSPSSSPTSSQKRPITALDNISIPSNLQDILNSIKNVSNTLPSVSTSSSTTIVQDEDEYTPSPVVSYQSSMSDYIPAKTSGLIPLPPSQIDQTNISATKGTSKLAQLTEAELLSMVPDDVDIGFPTSAKRSAAVDVQQPPPPGMEDEYVP